jgi:hypothetical protein
MANAMVSPAPAAKAGEVSASKKIWRSNSMVESKLWAATRPLARHEPGVRHPVSS